MLKPIYRDRNKAERPLQELCPWLDYVTPTLLLNKDGSLLAGFTSKGVDPDNIDDDQIDAAVLQYQQAVVDHLDERFTIWHVTKKVRDFGYPNSKFANTTSDAVDRAYGEDFRAGKYYKIERWTFMLFTGKTGVEGVMDGMQRRISEDGINPVQALLQALGGSVSPSAMFAADSAQLSRNVEDFERVLGSFVSSTPTIGYSRMEMREMDDALFQILNQGSREEHVKRPVDEMLDSWMPDNHVVAGERVLRFSGRGSDRYAAAYGVKRWPTHAQPMLLESLLEADNELMISQITRCMGRDMSQKVLKDTKNYHKLTSVGLFDAIIAKAASKSANKKSGKSDLIAECEDALKRLSQHGPTWAFFNLTVMVFADSQSDLENRCVEVERLFTPLNIRAIREERNLLPAYAATLPGQWAMQKRYSLMCADNVADLAPLYAVAPPSYHHPFFSEVFRKRVPALTSFVDRYLCRWPFVPHVGQTGHALLIAPTRAGKTTFVAWCLSQFQRYTESSIFIFDRDGSCKPVTKLHGGRHIDPVMDKPKLNPFMLDDGTPEGRLWLRGFLVRMIEMSGIECSATDLAEVDASIEMMRIAGGPTKRLSTFATYLNDRLSSALGEWLEGRPFDMFDNEDDDLKLTAWSNIEMSRFSSSPKLEELFYDYAFRRIAMMVATSKVTFIYIEEASILLKNPQFVSRLDIWLKTFGKLGVFVWMTVQSPDSIDVSAKSTIVDNVKTLILLYNSRAEKHRKFYKENLGLTDLQVDKLKGLKALRDYMIVQDTNTRIAKSAFNKEVLSYLRSEAHVQASLDRHARASSGGLDWVQGYVDEVRSMDAGEMDEVESVDTVGAEDD